MARRNKKEKITHPISGKIVLALLAISIFWGIAIMSWILPVIGLVIFIGWWTVVTADPEEPYIHPTKNQLKGFVPPPSYMEDDEDEEDEDFSDSDAYMAYIDYEIDSDNSDKEYDAYTEARDYYNSLESEEALRKKYFSFYDFVKLNRLKFPTYYPEENVFRCDKEDDEYWKYSDIYKKYEDSQTGRSSSNYSSFEDYLEKNDIPLPKYNTSTCHFF